MTDERVAELQRWTRKRAKGYEFFKISQARITVELDTWGQDEGLSVKVEIRYHDTMYGGADFIPFEHFPDEMMEGEIDNRLPKIHLALFRTLAYKAAEECERMP